MLLLEVILPFWGTESLDHSKLNGSRTPIWDLSSQTVDWQMCVLTYGSVTKLFRGGEFYLQIDLPKVGGGGVKQPVLSLKERKSQKYPIPLTALRWFKKKKKKCISPQPRSSSAGGTGNSTRHLCPFTWRPPCLLAVGSSESDRVGEVEREEAGAAAAGLPGHGIVLGVTAKVPPAHR